MILYLKDSKNSTQKRLWDWGMKSFYRKGKMK
jgi:hypothetical protein